MAGSIDNQPTYSGSPTTGAHDAPKLELKFVMTAPIKVNLVDNTYELSNTETIAGSTNSSIEPATREAESDMSSTNTVAEPSRKTGIKLFIDLKTNKIRVSNPKNSPRKRAADHLDADALDTNAPVLEKNTQITAARIARYTNDELEVALTLAVMKSGALAPKKIKLSQSSNKCEAESTIHSAKVSSSNHTAVHKIEPEDTAEPSEDAIVLKQTQATRKQRIVDPSDPADALLILGAIKAGSDIYDSDAEDLAGDVEASTTSKPELFRIVQWGPAATDTSNDGDFPTEPEFSQFVPGRWERLPNGTVRDQKHKLLVRLTSKDGKKVIFKNPPPKDWINQKAITCLNKRISQQIRRNTSVRFRMEVESYMHEERVWINGHLTAGKPADGWKSFVAKFNYKFAGKMLEGCDTPRPTRTHSSLTKEVERFGKDFYSKGKVPVTKNDKKGKGKGKGKGKVE